MISELPSRVRCFLAVFVGDGLHSNCHLLDHAVAEQIL